MVKWTAHAKAQLRRIHDYIAQDSALYAKRVSEELVHKTIGLDELPRKGHKVSELNEEAVRQLSPIVSEFETEEQVANYDRWFRAKVLEAMNSTKPRLPHDEAMAKVQAALEERRKACANRSLD